MNKRSSFYPNGEFIPYQMPQDFRPSSGRGSCGNCGLYSNKHGFCGVWRTRGELEELKILMFVINGEQDILKDNGRTRTLFSIIIIII